MSARPEGNALVCTVDGDIDHGILVDVSQEELRVHDELFGLETWGIRKVSNRPRISRHQLREKPSGSL